MMRMHDFSRRFLIATSLFLVLLTFPVFVNPTSVSGDGAAPDCERESGIYIKGNEDFKNRYDFAGEGTEDDPFIIEGLQIEVRGYGIRIRDTSAHFIIRNCEFEGQNRGWGSTAIYLSKAENGVIENCDFFQMNRGVAIHKSEDIMIQENEFNSVRIGIRIKHSTSIQISNNEITNTRWSALFIAYSYDCTVMDNTISSNEGIGVLLYDSGSCMLYGNYFEANEWGNAKDIAGELTATDTNLWDDDVSLGNEWDDYEGAGVYPIPGDRDSVDRYPIGSDFDTTAPEWNEAPEGQTIECGDGLEMILKATDASGISYYWINDTVNFSVTSMGTVTSIQPLKLGVYPLEVRAYDPFENFCSATLTVTVQDTICPEIAGPEDVTYKEGETGNTLVWSVSDFNPSTYEVYLDDVLIEDGSWVDGSIEISIDGLYADTYLYRIEVFDLGDNSASDEVTVVVDPEKTSVPTTTTPIPKPKSNDIPGPDDNNEPNDNTAPNDDSMVGPAIEPVVIASGIGIPTALAFAILFVIARRREMV
jgi:parallel beta-helix repeat protein